MTKERFKELKESHKGNIMTLCYEISCENGGWLNYQEFDNYFKQWLVSMNMELMFRTGNYQTVVDEGLKVVMNNLNKKYD